MGYESRPEQPPLRLFGGLNTQDSELGLPGVDSPSMVNVDLHPEGSIRMRNGTLGLSTPTGETAIDAVIRMDKPEVPDGWLYVIAGGKIYRVPEPGTWTWQTPLLAGDVAPTLVAQQSFGRENSRYNDEAGSPTEYPSVVYLPRSNGLPYILLGQTADTGDIVTLPAGQIGDGAGGVGTGVKGGNPDWTTGYYPTHMRMMSVGHGARMYAWGFDDYPDRVDYTELNVPYNYAQNDIDDPGNAQPLIDGGYFEVRRGDGDKVISVADMYSYKVIFKKNNTLIFTGDPGHDETDSLPWTLQAEFPVGCMSDQAWVKIGNDIMFWSNDGPRVLSAVQEYGDLAHANIGWKVNSLTQSVAPGYHEKIRCYHDATNLRVVWFVPAPGSTENDVAYVYYYQSEKWTKWTGPIAEMHDVLLLRSTSQQVDRVIGGSQENGLVQIQSGYTDYIEGDDNDDIATDYITNWINMGELSDAARGLWLDIMFGDDGPSVDIYYQTDLDIDWAAIPRITKSIGGAGSAWGKLIWGTSEWGATARAFRRYEMGGIFNLIRFKFAKTGSNGFEAMGYRIEARQKGARA